LRRSYDNIIETQAKIIIYVVYKKDAFVRNEFNIAKNNLFQVRVVKFDRNY